MMLSVRRAVVECVCCVCRLERGWRDGRQQYQQPPLGRRRSWPTCACCRWRHVVGRRVRVLAMNSVLSASKLPTAPARTHSHSDHWIGLTHRPRPVMRTRTWAQGQRRPRTGKLSVRTPYGRGRWLCITGLGSIKSSICSDPWCLLSPA